MTERSVNPWLITLAVCLPTFMEVLDTTVANVALPHMAGSLAASTDEATWVLTSYLVSNAIILPAAAWLGRTFGRKRFLMACIMLFGLSSAVCGAATSLGMLIVARIFQGLGGGALQPTSQAILFENFPPERRGVAAAMYGLAVVVAPIVGPILGGWITDNYSWRWIFYINLPIGLLALLLIWAFIYDPPYLAGKKTSLDVPGLALLALWVSAFQIMLDQGQLLDWFQSPVIVGLALASAVFFIAFVWWELRNPTPLVDLTVLRDRNCAAAALFYGVMGMALFSTNALLPLYLQGEMGYPAFQSGLSASPRGLGAFMSMLLVGRLISIIDTRLLVCAGFALLSAGTFWLGHLSPEMAMGNVALPIFVSGWSIGLIFVPLTTLNTSTVPNDKIGAATGITSLSRNLGGGIGISIAQAMVARSAQAHQNWLSGDLNNGSAAYRSFVSHTQGYLSTQMDPTLAHAKTMAMAYHSLVSQSALLAYVESFQTLAWVCLFCAPMILFLRKAKVGAKVDPMAH